MNSSDTRISTYLDDLARMLADLPPDERDDVLAGVREHLDATLAEHPDDPGAVDAALLRLGPPERVAAAARADLAPLRTGPTPRESTPRLARMGTALVTLSVLVPALAMLWERGSLLMGPSEGMFGTIAAPFYTVSVTSLPWLTGVVCLLAAVGLRTPTLVGLLAIGPATLVVVLVGAFWMSPDNVSALVVLLAALVVAVSVTMLALRAWRETRG